MKNKIFLFSIFCSLNAFTQTNCVPQNNPKKVLLFIDTNLSEQEIAVAKKAACKRGEEVRVIPSNHAEIDKAYKEYKRLDKAAENCQKNCDKIEAQSIAASEKYYALTDAINAEADLKSTLDEVRQKGQKLTNFTISGHNGGGQFGGEKFNISRYILNPILKEFEDINEIESVLLLGCYTGVQREISEWKKLFPKVKLIGGYDGSAPLSDRPQGHHYISDILLKENALKSIKTDKELNTKAKSLLSSLNSINSAVYINPACEPIHEDQDGYLYTSEGGRKFNPMIVSDCEKKFEKMRPMELVLDKYKSGELEPPTNTQAELRQIYNTYRSNHHCLTGRTDFTDPETVFNLLFWHGVKESFANFYEKDLKEAEEMLKSFNKEEALAEIDKSIKYNEEVITQLQSQLENIKNNPEDFWKEKQLDLEAKEKTFAETSKKFEELKQKTNNGATLDEEGTNLVFTHTLQKSTLENLKNALAKKDINTEIAEVENNIQMIGVMKSNLLSSKDKVQNLDLSKIKVPTKENIKKFTRKEAMETIHQINGVLTSMPTNSKATSALAWLKNSMSEHFTYHNNPFSWHEAVPKPEKPQRVFQLQDFQSSGFGGGMIGGSMGGGPF